MEKLRHLPDGELEVMQAIWHKASPVSRTDIEEEIGKRRQIAPTTILTFLSRLCQKGFLAMERRGRTNYYTPIVGEEEYLAAESRSVIDRLYRGSLTAFAATLSQSCIIREEVEALRKMIEEGSL